MSWKVKLEKKVKQEVFLRQFKSTNDVMDYLYKYFESFFDVDGADGIIELTRKSDFLAFKVYDRQLNMDDNGQRVIFSKVVDKGHETIGSLTIKDMEFKYNDYRKTVEVFSENLLESLAKNVFSSLVAANITVLK